MEKRLLIAVLLSFCILYLWGGLMKGTRDQKVIENGFVESKTSQKPNISRQNNSAPSLKDVNLGANQSLAESLIEKIKILETEKLVVKFSSLGGSISGVKIKKYDKSLPLKGVESLDGFADVDFSVVQSSSRKIVYSAVRDGVEVVKTYQISKDDYIVNSETKITNLSKMSNLKDIKIEALTIDMSNLDEEVKKDPSAARNKSLNEYLISTENGIRRKGGAYKFKDKEKESFSGNVDWFGFRDRYYCALVRPDGGGSGYSVNPLGSDRLKIMYSPSDASVGLGESKVYSSTIYFGPENLDVLKGYGLGFEKVRRYYKFGLFDAIAKAIYQIMHLLHRVVPNWGVSILLISVVVYFSMYPLTMKSMTSMKKMQAIQPKLVKLREKHKNNPQKLNKEMMEIYKENGVNPLGGCLPMVFQMPVFIGLYQVLWRDVSFKGAGFLWIKDLSQPDKLFLFPTTLPFIGNEFNLLPVVMIVVMFFQMKLSSKNMVSADPAQVAQQKMMGAIMPVFMGVIFYKFASGLTLYFTMFYMFSTLTQWKISKKG